MKKKEKKKKKNHTHKTLAKHRLTLFRDEALCWRLECLGGGEVCYGVALDELFPLALFNQQVPGVMDPQVNGAALPAHPVLRNVSTARGRGEGEEERSVEGEKEV